MSPGAVCRRWPGGAAPAARAARQPGAALAGGGRPTHGAKLAREFHVQSDGHSDGLTDNLRRLLCAMRRMRRNEGVCAEFRPQLEVPSQLSWQVPLAVMIAGPARVDPDRPRCRTSSVRIVSTGVLSLRVLSNWKLG